MDRRLRQLEQRLKQEPGDASARAALRAELNRLAGLDDRERWAQAEPSAVDMVLEIVGRVLVPELEPTGVADYAAGGQRHRIGAFHHQASGVLLHLVPGGRFVMGDPAVSIGEYPIREVTLPAFLVGRYPVTQADWDRVGGNDDRNWTQPELPIEGVSWRDAQEWLQKAGGGLRLLSENEWEYACRAGTRSAYFWGNTMDPEYCWHAMPADEWRTHPVHEHDAFANAFGLVDMAGHVWEWCQDAYDASNPLLPVDERPFSRWPEFAFPRVMRGGYGFSYPRECRSAHRNHGGRNDRSGGTGFRVACSLPL